MQRNPLQQDTIAATATPRGTAAIGIVRLSGPRAGPIACLLYRHPGGEPVASFRPRRVYFGELRDPTTGALVDRVVLTFMKAPHSYTGEDVVEIDCHGNPYLLGRVLALCVDHGARPAEPGEFTRRAFLNGKLDLSQAEAVVDLIQAQTDKSAAAAIEQLRGGLSAEVERLSRGLSELIALVEVGLDFPEEDLPAVGEAELQDRLDTILHEVESLGTTYRRGRVFRDGLSVAIIGKPNVGKSSLFNVLLREDRAIVTPEPGTTRDFLEETLHVDGFAVRLTDTAGVRSAGGQAEEEGVARARRRAVEADLILAVFDGSSDWTDEDEQVLQLAGKATQRYLCNKCDLPPGSTTTILREKLPDDVLTLSVTRGEGVDEVAQTLERLLAEAAHGEEEGVLVTRERHWRALQEAAASLRSARAGLANGLSGEFCAVDLYEARTQLDGILGRTVGEDILDRIFAEFCIGK